MSSDNEEKSSVDSEYKKLTNNQNKGNLQFNSSSSGLVFGSYEDEKIPENEENDILDELILHSFHNHAEDTDHDDYDEDVDCENNDKYDNKNIQFTVLDVSCNVTDLSCNAMDLSGNAMDLSGNAMDVSGNKTKLPPQKKQKTKEIKLTVVLTA